MHLLLFGFFQSDGKSFQVPFLSCGPLSTHLARLSEVLQYSRAGGPGRAGQRMDPILLSPLTRGKKKKAQRYLALRFLCSLCLAPPIEDTKKWAWRETRHRAPSRFSSPLGSRSPRDGGGGGKKKESTERRFHACRIPVLMTTSPPIQPLPYTRLRLL